MQEGSNFANLIYAGRKITVKDPDFFHETKIETCISIYVDRLLFMCNAVKYKGSKFKKESLS